MDAEPYPEITIQDGDSVYTVIDYSEYHNFTIKNGTVTFRYKENGAIIQEVHDTFTDVETASSVPTAEGSPHIIPVEITIYPDHSVERRGVFTTDNGHEIWLNIVFKSNEEWVNSQ